MIIGFEICLMYFGDTAQPWLIYLLTVFTISQGIVRPIFGMFAR